MKRTLWICWPVIAMAILNGFVASGAGAKDCGDTTGPPPNVDVPCDCGDTVTTDTDLDASDPVLRQACGLPAALLVAGGVRLDVSSARIRCLPSTGPATIGLWLTGNGVSIGGGGGIIELCDIGILVPTSHNTIEGVTVTKGGSVGVLVNFADDNTLRNIRCNEYTFFGIQVIGDGNVLERNYCQRNGLTGIIAVGSNTLNHNQGRNNGGQGVVAGPFFLGPPAQTDRRNYATGNGASPQCEIVDGLPPLANGKYC